ncbi:hypothetical protein BGZ50_006493 [Haplosporangium sp. Z 11]|nr:hypothetical protein BGZ50_006493 [Haplosporangium sp. Z 11]
MNDEFLDHRNYFNESRDLTSTLLTHHEETLEETVLTYYEAIDNYHEELCLTFGRSGGDKFVSGEDEEGEYMNEGKDENDSEDEKQDQSEGKENEVEQVASENNAVV